MNDPIADLIIRIKNASKAGRPSLVMPYSRFKAAIAELLQKEGFIKSFSKRGKKVAKFLEIELAYDGATPRVHEVKRVSRLSKRVYRKTKDIHSVRQGYGRLILSTPKGILTDKEARKEKIGGEALFEIW